MKQDSFFDHRGRITFNNNYKEELDYILFHKYGVKSYGENEINHLDCYVNDNGGETTISVHNYGVIVSVPFSVSVEIDEIKYHGIAENLLKEFDEKCESIRAHIKSFES